MTFSIMRPLVWTRGLPFIPYVLLFFLLSLFVGLPHDPIFYFSGDWRSGIESTSPTFFVVACLLLPLLAALTFQLATFWLWAKRLGYKYTYLLVVSALLFAFTSHGGGWIFASQFAVGLVFSLCYLLYRRRSPLRAYWATVAVYALRSTLAFVFSASDISLVAHSTIYSIRQLL